MAAGVAGLAGGVEGRGRRWPVGFVAGFALVALAFLYELHQHLGTAGDFWTFWAAARALSAGLSPYHLANLAAVAGPLPHPRPGPFLSPIFVAQLMAPLGALPFDAARLVWLGISLLCAALTLVLLLRLGGVALGAAALSAGLVLCMAFQPLSFTLWLGQTDTIVVAAVAVGWYAIQRGRPLLGGLAASLAAVDPHLLAGLGVYLLFRAVARRDRLPLAGFAIGGVLALGLCWLHPAMTTYWLRVTLPHAQAAAIEPWDTLNWLQAWSELLGPRLAVWPTLALDVALTLLALRLWTRVDATPARDLAVVAVWTLATTTFAYNQDYTLLLLAAPFFLARWRAAGSETRTGWLAFTLAVGYALSALTGGPVPLRHAGFVLLVPVVALAAVCALPPVRARLKSGYGAWAVAWVVATWVGYAVFSVAGGARWPSLLLLCGLVAFLAALWRWDVERTAAAGAA